MEINLKRISNPLQLEKIRDLYISAFPAEERREFYELTEMLHLNECGIYVVLISGGRIAGFCIVWDFESFAFIEHFAIDNNLRGLGIGEGVLTLFRKKYPVILLETELPVDEISQRRINFYQRNDFELLDREYFQPSYGKNKLEVKLNLMCTGIDFSVENLDDYIIQIKEKGYNKIS